MSLRSLLHGQPVVSVSTVPETTSPLDAALDDVQRLELGGEPSKSEENADPFASIPTEPAPTPKRGRPRNPNSRRARQGVYSGVTPPKPTFGKVSDPSVPDIRQEYPKIDPSSVAQSLRQLDAIIVKMAGTTPLTPEEIEHGGGVFAPVLDHYMPMLAEKGGVWIAPLTWMILAYGPRAYDVLDRKEREKKGLQPRPIGGAAGENGQVTFQSAEPDIREHYPPRPVGAQ